MSATEDAATDSTEDSTTTTTTTTNDLSASGELTGFTDASLEESATSLVTEEEIEAYETRVEEKAEKEEEEEVAEAPTTTTTDNTQPIFESATGTGSLTNDVPQMSEDGPSSLSLPQDLKR